MLAVYGVVRRNGRILMCKRPSGGAFPGFWEPPTECLDNEETLEDALEKVFFERLTVVPQTMTPLGATDAFCGENVRFLGYDVKLRKNFVHLYGYEDFRWVKPKNLNRLRVLKPFVTLLTPQSNV